MHRCTVSAAPAASRLFDCATERETGCGCCCSRLCVCYCSHLHCIVALTHNLRGAGLHSNDDAQQQAEEQREEGEESERSAAAAAAGAASREHQRTGEQWGTPMRPRQAEAGESRRAVESRRGGRAVAVSKNERRPKAEQ